jgi:putative two-component system response regulator
VSDGVADVKYSVLVVDDTLENIDVLRGVLSGRYTVKVATSGETALKVAASAHQPDLILLDVMMPEMDGYEVCRRLKAEERTRNIPIIFLTSKSDALDEALGFDLGAEDYIHKPINAPVVQARVATHLALYDRTRHLESIVLERTANLLAKSRELEETRMEIIRCLGRAIEYRDNDTGYHIVRMMHYVKLLATHAGLSDMDVEHYMTAAIMHDIGKIGVADNILLKRDKLTEEELIAIKRHPQIGADIIGKHSSALLRMSREVALTHHEKWDGSGYPQGLAGDAIPFAGRVTAVADVFDALTSARAYKKPWSIDEAMDYIRKESGRSLDPRLADLFVGLRAEVEEVMRTFSDRQAL